VTHYLLLFKLKFEVLVTLERVEDVKGSETLDTGAIHPGQSEANSNAGQESRPMPIGNQNSDVGSKVQSVIPEDEGGARIISQISHTNFNK